MIFMFNPVSKANWVFKRWFAEDEYVEAEAYRAYCDYNYQGTFTVERCSANHPRRFTKAVMT